MVTNDGSVITLVAAAALTEGQRVKIDSAGKAAVAGAEPHVGVVKRTTASGDPAPIQIMASIFKGIANEAIAVGGVIFPAAAGKVTDTDPTTHESIGYALTASAADGDVINWVPCSGNAG